MEPRGPCGAASGPIREDPRMSHDRTEGRRVNARAFRPAMDDQRLEPRLLMSVTHHAPYVVNQYLLTHPKIGNALKFNRPVHFGASAHPFDGPVFDKGVVATQTAHGGQ